MKISYKHRLFSWFLVIFVLFAISVIMLQRKEERKFRTENLKTQLDNYANIVHNYITVNNITIEDTITQIAGISNMLPKDIRLSIINESGKVLFDRDFPTNIEQMSNHLQRPEIQSAKYKGFGWNIRESNSVHKPFFYFARYYNNYYIRIALLYTDHTQSLLKADNYFIYIVLGLFIAILIFLYGTANRFGHSIEKLKKFSVDIRNGKDLSNKMDFPHDELGDIAKELMLIFNEQVKTNKALETEKEKMIQHLKYATEGLAIFDKNHKKIYANTHFYQIINLIAEKTTFTTQNVLEIPEFEPLKSFLKDPQSEGIFKSVQVNKNGKYILLNICKFDDKSYEIRLSDITKMEKTKILKQQMTSNIAHELRTPTTCLRGFLETLCENPNIPDDKRNEFIKKAYHQSERLTQLIEDISLLSSLAENSSNYKYKKVNIKEICDSLKTEFQQAFNEAKIDFHPLSKTVDVVGNYSLLYSVLSNLVDNSLKYAGENSEIYIKHLQTKENSVYLSYYDTGIGIEESHLNRIFERFYRTNKGRTRNTGGSGLGLSIVYNIIQMHKGDIQVKLHPSGGLEYQIRLEQWQD
ncbi:MAG: two-component sensor histidine kinase [Bacteroidales bacterium]|nr:MAG: two-component sensor histidine kinase [Bacteroidales bacterium]